MQLDLYQQAQDFRIALYKEMKAAAGYDSKDIWESWKQIPYSGPNREEILQEMKTDYLKKRLKLE